MHLITWVPLLARSKSLACFITQKFLIAFFHIFVLPLYTKTYASTEVTNSQTECENTSNSIPTLLKPSKDFSLKNACWQWCLFHVQGQDCNDNFTFHNQKWSARGHIVCPNLPFPTAFLCSSNDFQKNRWLQGHSCVLEMATEIVIAEVTYGQGKKLNQKFKWNFMQFQIMLSVFAFIIM